MIRPEYKCDFEKCRHNVHGVCCRLRFDLCKYYRAKVIIKGLLSCCRNYPQENAEKMKQAEQFLKEIEK